MHLATVTLFLYALGMGSVVAGIATGSLNEVLVGTTPWFGSLAMILISDSKKPSS